MGVYGGIDLHANNSVLVLVDETGQSLYQKRLPNDLTALLDALSPYREQLVSVAVESTFNWYWLVDGLRAAGVNARLCDVARSDRYDGLKYGDDQTDARWLAEMQRLGVLPEGYVCPPEWRGLRDLLRKRGQLVRQRTAQYLSIHGIVQRCAGRALSRSDLKALGTDALGSLLSRQEPVLAVQASLAVVEALTAQIQRIEATIKAPVRLRSDYRCLKTVPGIGEILGLMITLETGEIGRFAHAGKYASYARCVKSERWSNGKKKGAGARRAGNKYLAWAFVEAAQYARRHYPVVRRFYDRKAAKRGPAVATKALANKLARASFHVMRDRVAFDMERVF